MVCACSNFCVSVCLAALHHPVAHLVWHEKSPLAGGKPQPDLIMGTMLGQLGVPTTGPAKSHVLKDQQEAGCSPEGRWGFAYKGQ